MYKLLVNRCGCLRETLFHIGWKRLSEFGKRLTNKQERVCEEKLWSSKLFKVKSGSKSIYVSDIGQFI